MERKNLVVVTGFRNLDGPALSKLLHRLRHPGTLENVPNMAIYFVARHSKIENVGQSNKYVEKTA
jgi:hypothetical protein